MSFPVLKNYLARLSHQTQAGTSVWLDAEGRALGRFFNCTMTSAFQPLREIDSGKLVAFEGLARSVSKADQGLSLWRLLDHAASDDESVELDRLCRMLHAINFFRQAEAQQTDLYLNVHDRLLSAVSSNHGHAFQRILDALGLPIERIVLQLPTVTPNQGWLLNYVADNYRRNGFRLAINVSSVHEASDMLQRLHPQAFKLDAGNLGDEQAIASFVTLCHAAKIRLIFKRLDTPAALAALQRVTAMTGLPIVVQGYLLDQPLTALAQAKQDVTVRASTA
ncbi:MULTISPECIES: EAL domain-containing protein [unclassified Janthinobacterium]|uniref:EAL domain-containing protein n=1 Tax=unclassified Janthinobacterium TaxID=2610881 RepID=UPI0018CBBED7|nr:EAL domain-containing protein [Janthinobacterium sp. CG_23.4]MDH6157655.1 EAL domain-containing protein (putative c-di-GMP-specific phosphodiesterase class I) [Janthinobacterium sp. CG_23.4]